MSSTPRVGGPVQRLELTTGLPEDDKDFIAKYGIRRAGRKAVRLGRRHGVFHQGAPGLGRRGGLLRRALRAAVHGGDRQIRGGPEHIHLAARRLRLGRRAAVYALCPTQSLALGDGARINAGTPWSCRTPEARNMWVYTTGRGAARATAAHAR